jgi:predicted deacetylase
MKNLIVSIHDVHPESFHAAAQQVAFCESLGVRRFSLLVVPDFHRRTPLETSPKLVAWLRSRQDLGDEVALHGLYHYNDARPISPRFWFFNRLYTSNEAEFLNLDFQDACSRMSYGKQRLERAGLHPVGFVAPAWLMSRHVSRAVFYVGFLYTNTVASIVPASGETLRCQSLCYSARAGWRQAASLAWNSGLWVVKRHHHVVRLSLHPHDLTVSAFRTQISGILSSASYLGFHSTTYRDFVEPLRTKRAT